VLGLNPDGNVIVFKDTRLENILVHV
jgi:hypothetical protein